MTFQLTFSRRGWPLQDSDTLLFVIISTHILVKRMTMFVCLPGIRSIFQLTSSQGGWRTLLLLHHSVQHFNSHPHEEDDRSLGYWYMVLFFSTHILTRRMTGVRFWHLAGTNVFNSHPHKEDDCHGCHTVLSRTFFNSHPHKEDDEKGTHYKRAQSIFQLTSSRGGWHRLDSGRSRSHLFNSHPHEEDDRGKLMADITITLFNSHPHEEDDYLKELAHRVLDFSTHILTRRMTPAARIPCTIDVIFNSHPHEEDDGL